MFRRTLVAFLLFATTALCVNGRVCRAQNATIERGRVDVVLAQLQEPATAVQPPVAEARPAAIRTLPAGLRPLTEMSVDDKYKNEEGGLYGGGRNEPPEAHRHVALHVAQRIRPLDADGNPDERGKIALASIGMSNTTQEFQAFMRLARGDTEKSPSVVLVDGAQGAKEALAWARDGDAPGPIPGNPWEVLDLRLKQSGVTAPQVQVVWLKQARANPAALGEFPRHADEYRGHLVTIVRKLHDRFPNLRIVYLSSRIYAGYAKSTLNPEPFAYESAFAVRSLIKSQIGGDPSLNFDTDKGPVKAPLLLWGPYLWADGETGRRSDDLVWKEEDFAQDGTHPSPSGQRKVAGQLLRFLKNDPTAKPWFVAETVNP